ncbi:MAG: DEDD exonuclease domain-containing protein [Ilumatobacteraceae bacterium]
MTGRESTTVQKSFDDAGTPLAEVTFCVLDLETTGGSAEDDRITEIGAVKYRGGECLGTFQTLVNPGRAIPPYITVLTGITESMVLPAPLIEAVLPSLTHFIGDAVVVAHNSRFDIGFLNAALIRADRDPLTNRVLDTVPLARRLVRDEVPDCKLGTLASRLRLAHQPNHRALDDALTTADLLHFLIERASGFGVMGLDDLIGLPRLDTHPLAAKLRLTEDLPRAPGVYMFSDANGRVLYVGKATNLRQRVRSYFSTGETRRKIGALLRQTHGIHHIETPDPLTAGILELRLIRRLLPHYNRAGTTVDKYCYVRLTTDEEWPRLVITKNPSTKGLHIGPLSSRTSARLVVEAIESVVPLRRCTVRMGRNYVPPADAPVCSAAQLGVAHCPCSGHADRETYGEIVRHVEQVLTGSPEPLVERLRERIAQLSAALRFEEAAETRDRVNALLAALARQRSIDALRRAGRLRIRQDEVDYEFTDGVLTGVARRGELFTHIGVPLDLTEALSPPTVSELGRPLDRDAADEVNCIARHLETSSTGEVLECSGTWTYPSLSLPSVRRVDRCEGSFDDRRVTHH